MTQKLNIERLGWVTLLTAGFSRVFTCILCIVALPVHLCISALIRIADNGSALYKSQRLGKGAAVFEFLKYRSMKVDCPELLTSGLKVIVHDQDPRITTVGKWLRIGIDELPQLWNVVRGEMAWIGPRPDPVWMLKHYGPVCQRRLSVLPGITGFAQVLDSRNLSTAEGLAIDLWYLAHRSVWLNAWIVLVTPLFMVGWRSLGRKRLAELRSSSEFQELCRECEAELSETRLQSAERIASVQLEPAAQ